MTFLDAAIAVTLAFTVIILAYAVVTLVQLARKEELAGLILEGPGGKASLSRFQLLLFTFVVAGLLLVLSVQHGQFVEIPNGVLGLLGISGGSFLISKGIGAAGGSGDTPPPAPPAASPATPPTVPGA